MANIKRRASVRIRPHEAGLKLLDFLTDRFTYKNRNQWQKSIVAGSLRVNRKATISDRILECDDTVEYRPPEQPEPSIDQDFTILYEDEDLLAINKSGNLPCHPSGRYFTRTLWYLLKNTKNLDYMGMINRLDRETSGIVLIAKNKEAARCCRQQFERRTVQKHYSVLVEGPFPKEPIHARGMLELSAESEIRKKYKFSPIPSDEENTAAGKFCETIFKNQDRFKEISLISAVLITGRTHQIRATLNSLGYPVVGDKLYGVDETIYLRFISDQLTDKDSRRLRIPRQALHAAMLRLEHPTRNTPMTFEAPMPSDMLKLMENDRSNATSSASQVDKQWR
ncbi:MAG TPA: RluA family pseudouridine synthase [Deltaproteobacteria bacterium]|nr:RluA family pseudouridine synthase [Deltaproteobacteria bacterium]